MAFLTDVVSALGSPLIVPLSLSVVSRLCISESEYPNLIVQFLLTRFSALWCSMGFTMSICIRCDNTQGQNCGLPHNWSGSTTA